MQMKKYSILMTATILVSLFAGCSGTNAKYDIEKAFPDETFVQIIEGEKVPSEFKHGVAGEAVISFLQSDGTPGIAQKARVLPPQSRFGAITEEERAQKIRSAALYGKYAEARDPESAYEILERLGFEKEEALRRAKEEAEEAKRRAKEEAEEAKRKEKEEAAAAKQREKEEREAQREAEKAAEAKKRAAKSVGSTVAGTVGREVGKTVGGTIGGTFGKTLGGNLGASLGRGILNTLFGK